jgi:predicted nucleic acid-binding protein
MGPPRIVLDTNVLASAFTSGRGASREVLRRVLQKNGAQALISVPASNSTRYSRELNVQPEGSLTRRTAISGCCHPVSC